MGAAQKHLLKIEVCWNNIIRTLTWNKKFSHTTILYKNNKILKLNDVYKLELAKFLYKLSVLFHCNWKIILLRLK